MSLSGFVDEVRDREKTLTVFTASEDEQLFAELRNFFEVQNITVREGRVEPGGPGNFVVLHQEGEAVAVSTLEDLRDSLFIGGASSRFRGDISLAGGETPDVITSLGNTTFSADGGDDHLLTQIAHYIVDLAFRAGEGTLHSGVRRLSALGENGGVEIYRKLATAGVDTHVYGAPDAEAPPVPGLAVHGEEAPEVAETRFVVFDGAGDDAGKAAMVAVEDDDGSFRGFWTFEAEFVDEIADYVDRTYGE